METDAPYPASIGKGRTGYLPREFEGSPTLGIDVATGDVVVLGHKTIQPYGGMTGEEWEMSAPYVSEIEDKRPKRDQEELGQAILYRVHNAGDSQEITASQAADLEMRGYMKL